MQNNERYGSVAASMQKQVFGQQSPTSGLRGAHSNKYIRLIFTSGACFKIQSSCELSAHGWGKEKKYSKYFSMSSKSASSSTSKGADEIMPLSADCIKITPAEKRAVGLALSRLLCLVRRGKRRPPLRHINTLPCTFLLFQNLLLPGPVSSAATHIFGTPS